MAGKQAYDIFVRGGVGRDAQIGRSLFRRVPSDGLEAAVEGLVRAGSTAGWKVRASPRSRGG